MTDIMKIVQALEDSNILLKGVTKTIEKEKSKKKDWDFQCCLILQQTLKYRNFVRMNQD